MILETSHWYVSIPRISVSHDLRFNFYNIATQVYLVNGTNAYSGRVVITYNGINGTVCDDRFGTNDARVICRMAGHR